jgi:hypothetical protein
MSILSWFSPKPSLVVVTTFKVKKTDAEKLREAKHRQLAAELRLPMPIDPEFERIVKLQPEKPRVRVKAGSLTAIDEKLLGDFAETFYVKRSEVE